MGSVPIDVCAPSDPPNDGLMAMCSTDIGGADLVQPEPAVGLGNLEPQQVEVGGLLQQLARERPVVRVQAVLVAAAPRSA